MLDTDPRFATLQTLAQRAGLTAALDDPDAAITVFAPPDTAFEALPDALAAAPAATQALLEAHVLDGTFRAADLSDGQTLTTVAGVELTVSIAAGTGDITLTAGGGAAPAAVLVADLDACAATVHVIDAVLVPAETALDHGGGAGDDDVAPIGRSPPPEQLTPLSSELVGGAGAAPAAPAPVLVEGNNGTRATRIALGSAGAVAGLLTVLAVGTGVVYYRKRAALAAHAAAAPAGV